MGPSSKALTVTDGSLDFAIDLAAGTLLTGTGGVALDRLVLSIDDGNAFEIAEDVIALSPVYRLTGYHQGAAVERVDFAPAARISLRYDADALPEFVFLPHLARYDDDGGLVQLPPAPGVLELGIATGLTDHASLFVVTARLAPEPPPLPEEFEVEAITVEPIIPILEAGDLVLTSREIQAGEQSASA